MDASMAVGLYRTSFGPVKIEADATAGPGHVMGVWTYDRQGQQVIGFFSGRLDGNVLGFTWTEPADPQPLSGRGYLVFETTGTGFFGRWWTHNQDRGGEWSGEKAYVVDGSDAAGWGDDDGYGGDGYDGYDGYDEPSDGGDYAQPPPADIVDGDEDVI